MSFLKRILDDLTIYKSFIISLFIIIIICIIIIFCNYKSKRVCFENFEVINYNKNKFNNVNKL